MAAKPQSLDKLTELTRADQLVRDRLDAVLRASTASQTAEKNQAAFRKQHRGSAEGIGTNGDGDGGFRTLAGITIAETHNQIGRPAYRKTVKILYRAPFAETALCVARRLTASLCLTISITERPFSASAPVGQACTHLPQPVQLLALPQSSFRSLTMRE